MTHLAAWCSMNTKVSDYSRSLLRRFDVFYCAGCLPSCIQHCVDWDITWPFEHNRGVLRRLHFCAFCPVLCRSDDDKIESTANNR